MNTTQTMNTQHCLALCALGLSSCMAGSDPPVGAGAEARLKDAHPGDEIRYERISLTPGAMEASIHPDTLILELTERLEDAFVFTERLSTGSESRNAGAAVEFPDEIYTYTLATTPDRIEIESNEGALHSRLFVGISDSKRVLPISDVNAEVVDLIGDRLDTEFIPKNRTLLVQGETFTARLEHADRSERTPGFTSLYSVERGLELSLIEFGFEGEAYGWRRID